MLARTFAMSIATLLMAGSPALAQGGDVAAPPEKCRVVPETGAQSRQNPLRHGSPRDPVADRQTRFLPRRTEAAGGRRSGAHAAAARYRRNTRNQTARPTRAAVRPTVGRWCGVVRRTAFCDQPFSHRAMASLALAGRLPSIDPLLRRALETPVRACLPLAPVKVRPVAARRIMGPGVTAINRTTSTAVIFSLFLTALCGTSMGQTDRQPILVPEGTRTAPNQLDSGWV